MSFKGSELDQLIDRGEIAAEVGRGEPDIGTVEQIGAADDAVLRVGDGRVEAGQRCCVVFEEIVEALRVVEAVDEAGEDPRTEPTRKTAAVEVVWVMPDSA